MTPPPPPPAHSASRRAALRAGGALCLIGFARGASAASCPADGSAWPAWVAFRQQFISDDGRVIDKSSPRGQTVSEAQAYALFFALVADDRSTFARLLQWTENNLAGGDLTARLPAWQWGKRDDGQWGVVDANSATDADLWLIQALGEAGRLWNQPRYTSLAALLARRLWREAAVEMPGLGLTLLPGVRGFQTGDERWRLNPSYYPMQQLRWLAATYPADPQWQQLRASGLKVLLAPRSGLAPDWIVYDAKQGFQPDEPKDGRNAEGAHDAIRVYLWAGLMNPADPVRAQLLARYVPMARLVDRLGFPPESLDTNTGAPHKDGAAGPPGFSAALLPFLRARGDKAAFDAQTARLTAKPMAADAYYDNVLNLFAQGFLESRYRFTVDGRVEPDWAAECARAR